MTTLRELVDQGPNLTCQLCGDRNFDAVGLRMHYKFGWCEVLEQIPATDREMNTLKKTWEPEQGCLTPGDGNG